LTAAVEPLEQAPEARLEELAQTGHVPVHSVVVVVPSEFRVDPCKQLLQPQVTMCLAPLREPLPRGAQLRSSRAPFEVRPALPISAPPKLESQKLEAGLAERLVPTEGDDSRLRRRQRQPKFLQAWPQRRIEASRIRLVCKSADGYVL
jgi:hypothetical protein